MQVTCGWTLNMLTFWRTRRPKVQRVEEEEQSSEVPRTARSNAFTAIRDRFSSVREVTMALKQAGLESSNLIFAIDYTMSNLQQGQRTFNGRSLHTIQEGVLNPYQVSWRCKLVIKRFSRISFFVSTTIFRASFCTLVKRWHRSTKTVRFRHSVSVTCKPETVEFSRSKKR